MTLVTTAPLACTVRDCGLMLESRGRTLACARGHTYDVARAGYVNLLQPHDRRSAAAGDSKAAILARARLAERGIGRAIRDAVVERARRLLPRHGVVIDIGCGDGALLAALADDPSFSGVGVGIDLSRAAVEYAARRAPGLTWVVANADRRLPLLDRTVDLALSIHGRRHPRQCDRVLTRDGHLIVAVPAEDDLIELRAAVQGEVVGRSRGPALAAEHAPCFTIVERVVVRERHRLDRDALTDLLAGTYRGARFSAARRAEALEAMDVTLASEIVTFKKAGAATIE